MATIVQTKHGTVVRQPICGQMLNVLIIIAEKIGSDISKLINLAPSLRSV